MFFTGHYSVSTKLRLSLSRHYIPSYIQSLTRQFDNPLLKSLHLPPPSLLRCPLYPFVVTVLHRPCFAISLMYVQGIQPEFLGEFTHFPTSLLDKMVDWQRTKDREPLHDCTYT